jgi:NAD(P)-dependent dehydrogenase (short-subunit alcohol dehydrogenase family)
VTRVAIVTGGASGIGRALSAALVGRGVHVVVADLDAARAAQVADELTAAGPGAADARALDVSDGEAFRMLVEGVAERHGRLDFLFNNAGVGVAGEPEELTLAHWDRAIDVNLKGAVHGCHAAYPIMKRQGFGHIVNTGSIAGLVGGIASSAPYVTTKHGVVGLSLSLRVTAAPFGVGVHVVCPGAVDTPLLDSSGIPGLPTPASMEGLTLKTLANEAGMKRFYPPEKLAEDVLDGVAKGRAVIVAPPSAKVVWWVWRLTPGLLMRAMIAGSARWRRKQAVE